MKNSKPNQCPKNKSSICNCDQESEAQMTGFVAGSKADKGSDK